MTGQTACKDKKQTGKIVLKAAGRVFARHPYNAASLRMIAAEGGFGHALIAYYYPTKAALFEAVSAGICAGLYEAHERWLAEVRTMNLEDGFGRYVDRVIEFSRKSPLVFRIIILNIAGEKMGAVPGRDRLVEVFEGMRRSFAETMRLNASPEEIGRFSDSFNALVLYYLGAPESAAWLLRLDPEGSEYAAWVKTTLVSLFLPMLAGLFRR